MKNETQKNFEAVKHVNEISKPSEITKLFPNIQLLVLDKN